MTAPHLDWRSDQRFVVDGIEFVQQYDPGSTPTRFHLAKHRLLTEAYVAVLGGCEGGSIVELGIANGGSAALVELVAAPRRLLAVDLVTERVAALDEFIAARGAADRLRIHYGVDQADGRRLRELVAEELGGHPIDLVIDDASHLYGATRASFEALFPLVRPGGRYLIEDWTWQLLVGEGWNAVATDGTDEERSALVEALRPAIVAGLTDPDPVARRRFAETLTAQLEATGDTERISELWAEIRRLERDDVAADPSSDTTEVAELGRLPHLAFELVLAAAREGSAIASVSVDPYWITITRGDGHLDPEGFRLADLVDDPLGLL